MASLTDAFEHVFQQPISTDGVPFAGRLDPLIITDILALNRLPDTPAHRRALRDAYTQRLQSRLAQPPTNPHLPPIARALPGVLDLLAALERLHHPSPAQPPIRALLTGNFEEAGLMKLRAAGIDPARFAFGIWGDLSPHHPPKREHLVPLGIDHAQRLLNRPLEPHHTVVIGDTPHDVAAARAHRCRSLAVATGRSSVADLKAAGADLALPDLTDTPRILAWLLQPTSHP